MTAWINPEGIILGEIHPTLKNKCHIVSYVDTKKLNSQSQVEWQLLVKRVEAGENSSGQGLKNFLLYNIFVLIVINTIMFLKIDYCVSFNLNILNR